ncbi:MAG: hypothetical protein JW900_01475 [Anaerolineae bacterium]|nr:hypothetical protein [Anaerolineae bacterium]
MRRWYFVAVAVIFSLALLSGCGDSEEATPAGQSGGFEWYTSETLDTSYEDALDASSQLALGTLELEGTEYAVTTEQATALLPLWQALQGTVTAQEEVAAVLRQIERTMSDEQLQAIAAMQLTQESLAAWMEENGMEMPPPGSGGMGSSPGMPEEQQEAFRATVQAGGGGMGPGGGQGIGDGTGWSEEQRETFRATMEAGGGGIGSGGPPASGGMRGGRAVNLLAGPLVDLLTQRAGE